MARRNTFSEEEDLSYTKALLLFLWTDSNCTEEGEGGTISRRGGEWVSLMRVDDDSAREKTS